MRTHCLFIILLIISNWAISQSFDNQSAVTYVYQPNLQEVKKILKKGEKVINMEMLHTLVDSFPSSSNYHSKLSPGQYLLTKVNDRFFEVRFVQIHQFIPYIHGSLSDLKIELTDVLGNKITDALVNINNSRIRYSNKKGYYTSKNAPNESLLMIGKDGIVDFFKIEKDRLNHRTKFRWKRIHHYAPIRFIWYPFRDIYRSIAYGYPNGWIRSVTNPFLNPKNKFKGYVVFSKPKYKPGQTIKVKAYVTNRNGKPIKKPLEVYLNHDYKRTKLATLEPYKPGGYEYQFSIPDSLNLKRDKTNYIIFESKNDELTGNFEYTEYELSETTFALGSEKKKHFRSKDLEIELTAIDENGLNASGVTAEISIISEKVKTIDTIVKSVQSVLFRDTIMLSTSEATKYIISDTLFHGLNLQYKIEVLFRDADGRTKTKQQYINYDDNPYELKLELKGDSVLFSSTIGNKTHHTEAEIDIDFYDGDWITKSVQLPHSEKINQYATAYWIETNESSESLDLEELDDGVSCNCFRNIDSIYFQVQNSRKIEFNYEVYKRGKKTSYGATEGNLKYSIKNNKSSYFLHLSYVWAGEPRKKQCRTDFYEKNLNVNIEAPSIVVPGQDVEFKINVTDMKGNPVSKVDLTGLGYTKKLKNSSPANVPYYGKSKKLQKRKRAFETSEISVSKKKLTLDFDSLKLLYGLDSMEYYQLLYPKSGLYKKTFPMDINGTEFSPFYSENGAVYQPEIIYVDGRPIYYRLANHTIPRYSFKVSPGTHHIMMRMQDKLVSIKGVQLLPGKTILHITKKAPGTHVNVTISEKPSKLERYEKNNLWKHLIQIHLDNRESAVISQGNYQQFISNSKRRGSQYLVGPIGPGKFKYYEPEIFTENLEMEHGYTFYVEPNKLKMKSCNQNRSLGNWLYKRPGNPISNPLQHSLQQSEIDEYLEEIRLSNFIGDNVSNTSFRNGQIQLLRKDLNQPLKAILLLNPSDPNFLKFYARGSINLRNIIPGKYKIVVLGKDRYMETPDFYVNAKGTTYINLGLIEPQEYNHKLDSIKSYFDQYLKDIEHKAKAVQSKSSIKSTLYEYVDYSNSDGKYVIGQVLDASGEPIIGASIVVKGTANGTISDIEGYYRLFVPESAEIQVSFIGFNSLDFTPGARTSLDITLNEDVQQLQEIVVTAMGFSREKKSLGYSVTTLQGKVAGVNIQSPMDDIKIRGAGSPGSAKSLYVIDGVIFDELPESLSNSNIVDYQVLKGEVATALYGANAINGVIVISTKSGASKRKLIPNDGSQSQKGRIRSNFSDECIWQPKLQTDSNGEVTFTQKFPDDITSWNIHFLAASKHKYTGKSSTVIKTFQPVNAKLIVPNFLIEGDQVSFRGKISNYTADSLDVISSFKIKSDSTLITGKLKDYRIDQFDHTVDENDSLEITYKIEYGNNVDGEKRVIPVRKKGVIEHDGRFFELRKDSVYQFELSDQNEFRVYHNPVQNLRNDLLNLTNYAYNCNEQMASKLLAWMYYEEASESLGEQTKDHKRKVSKLIKRLLENRNSEGLWGWWGISNTQWWISKHVMEALTTAKSRGYQVQFLSRALESNLIWELTSETDDNKIYILEILRILDYEAVNYKNELSFINFDSLSSNQKLRVAHLSLSSDSIIGLPFILSTVNKNPFGGAWWRGDMYRTIENNNTTNTALALHILSELDTLENLQFGATSYLISKKGSKGYRNTYESVTTINRLMKYFLKHYSPGKPEIEIISNQESTTITNFPYSGKLQKGAHKVTNSGGGQLFFTHFKSSWNPTPLRVDSLIKVSTVVDSLSIGKTAKMNVSIFTKHSLDYVMVSVPIPAGCSFQNKPRYISGADHVEYLYDRVNLYFSYLSAGTKKLQFDLNPRFEGNFTLNPAIVELMYFPSYFGREEMKRVGIKND